MQRQRKLAITAGIAAVVLLIAVVAFAQLSLSNRAQPATRMANAAAAIAQPHAVARGVSSGETAAPARAGATSRDTASIPGPAAALASTGTGGASRG